MNTYLCSSFSIQFNLIYDKFKTLCCPTVVFDEYLYEAAHIERCKYVPGSVVTGGNNCFDVLIPCLYN